MVIRSDKWGMKNQNSRSSEHQREDRRKSKNPITRTNEVPKFRKTGSREVERIQIARRTRTVSRRSEG
jgi:hypothetical protein